MTESNRRLTVAGLLLLMFLPVFVFYGLLFKNEVNIPYWDDYLGVLQYLEDYSRQASPFAKVLSVLTTQHNEYKTVFANAVMALQYEIFQHPNFVVLSWIGNAFVLLLFWLIWHEFLPQYQLERRLFCFLPIAFLLFQLQYWETLDWASPGLQNLPVLIFALAAIQQLGKRTRAAFLLASLFMILAIASSGNGFGLLPVGVMLLWQHRSLRRLGAWVAVGCLCAAGYFYRYNFQIGNGSVRSAARSISPLFALSFTGAALGDVRPHLQFLAIPAGAMVLAIFLMMVLQKYHRRNSSIFYYTAFLLLTAFAVSGIRSKLGLAASLASRYTMYSDLLLISIYIFLLETVFQSGKRERRFVVTALACSMFFCLRGDRHGRRCLRSGEAT